MKMANVVFTIVTLLAAVSHVAYGKEFDCEGWLGGLSPTVKGKITCGEGGMMTLCVILVWE